MSHQMTDRRRILAAIRGEEPDRIPFQPRLEFWYRARRHSGTLPPELHGLSLQEIVDQLGVGFYFNQPDFTEYPGEDMADRPLGIWRLPVLPYKVTREDVDRRVTHRSGETVVEYHTPLGTVRTRTTFTEEMLQAGVS